MPNTMPRVAGRGSPAVVGVALLLAGRWGVWAAGRFARHTTAAGPASPSSPLATLWNQTQAGNTGGSVTVSSNFEALYDIYDSQAADDFEVPGGVMWRINQVFVSGTYEGGTDSSTVTSLLIQIYADNNGLPGTRLISQTVPSGQILGLTTGQFTVTVSPTFLAAPGRYWLMAQANKPDYFTSNGRQWEWYGPPRPARCCSGRPRVRLGHFAP